MSYLWDRILADFLAREDLPAAYAEDAAHYLIPLGEQLVTLAGRTQGQTLVVGINGAQGTGKSTLCLLLAKWLAAHDLAVANLSIDDFYLPRQARLELARRHHPLLQSRGVPGTHDIGLLESTLQALKQTGGTQEIALPRFDKAVDDRVPLSDWPRLAGPIQVILLEGWFVGAGPQTKETLRLPVNELEAREDPDGRWRRWVNTRLREDYQAVFARLDRLIMLAAPSFDQVYQWRALQEAKLRHRRGGQTARLMDTRELQRFIQHFERLTRHCLATLPARADVVLELDTSHRVAACRGTLLPGAGR